MIKVYLMHSYEYIKEHYYADKDGDIWEKEKYRDYFDTDGVGQTTQPEGYGDSLVFFEDYSGKILINDRGISDVDDIPMWAVKKVLTEKENPEYFV